MQQLLDESSSDTRDMRYKFLAIGDMLRQQQQFSPTPSTIAYLQPRSTRQCKVQTSNGKFPAAVQHDCAAICKARKDDIQHEVHSRLKAQMDFGRDIDNVTAVLQASRARHTERTANVKDLEARLLAAENGLAAAVSAQQLALARASEAPPSKRGIEQSAESAQQSQSNRVQGSLSDQPADLSQHTQAANASIRQQLTDEQRRVRELERQLQGVIKGEDMRPIEFQLHDREVNRKLHAEMQEKAAANLAASLQQVEKAAADDKVAMQQALTQALEECRDLRVAMARSEQEREEDRCEWQRMLLETQSTLQQHEARSMEQQQQAQSIRQQESPVAPRGRSSSPSQSRHHRRAVREAKGSEASGSCDSSDAETASQASTREPHRTRRSRGHAGSKTSRSQTAPATSRKEETTEAFDTATAAELASLRQEIQQMKSSKDGRSLLMPAVSTRRLTRVILPDDGSDQEKAPQQQSPAATRRSNTLRSQIQQAVAAASRRSTRFSSGGVPGEVIETIDLDQLQQELTAILSHADQES